MDNLIDSDVKYRIHGWMPLPDIHGDVIYLSNLSEPAEDFRSFHQCVPVKWVVPFGLTEGEVDDTPGYLACWGALDNEWNIAVDKLLVMAAQPETRGHRGQSNLVEHSVGSGTRVARWLPRAFDRVQELVRLPTGWDGEGSSAVTHAAASSALTLVSALASRTSLEPALIPTREGRLQLEWHEPTAHLEVEIAGNGESVHLWYHDVQLDAEREETIEPLRLAIGEIDALLAVLETRA